MQTLLTALVSQIVKRGDLTLRFADGGQQKFGDGTGEPIIARFTDARGPLDLLRDPELAFGELYMDGRLVMDEGAIFDLIKIVLSNPVRGEPPRLLSVLRWARDIATFTFLRNERSRARANVAHHYDLDGRIYGLFLDRDRQYSCAYFERPDMDLDEAQLAKKRHIAAKLLVDPAHRVLDIGSGWGGLALYLAHYCGANVTGVTLSEEQLAMANMRAQNAACADRVQFRLQDYRDMQGAFDRVVSVGMFEHVGPAHFETYFRRIAQLLTEDGVALVHTIGRPDGPGATNPWISKYIFPGGYIPSLSEISTAIEKTGLFITDIEVLRMHYAETLKAWRERFMARRDEARALYDERFCRMWEFYLSICELTFRVEGECVYQVQVARRHDIVPITRSYIAEREARLRVRDAGELAPAQAAAGE
ncbi:MAG: class I SAM-dependent methyltransferase [Hyphomicrobiales bacterium]|nr:class I SAM-dependent methyltransferase [Hyphomicrobiales bacterium]